MTSSEHDVIVIGGGPAGSTAATVLAQHGRRALVLEKSKFPRYHVGESLMPLCYFPLERLGLLERMRDSHFPVKYSVQFVRQTGEVSVPFYFIDYKNEPSSVTWQVLRSEFDQMLLDNARDHGAEVREEMTVTEMLRDGEKVVGVRATDAAGTTHVFRAPVTIDASGRDAFAIKKNGWQVRDPVLNKVAIWTYYRGAVRDPGRDEGATTVAYLPNKGWFWYIPLPDDMVSVGVVAERDYLFREGRDLKTILQREVRVNPWVERHLAPGTDVGPYRITSEFSYRSQKCASDGLVLVGDAFGFLDPVFSSGVLLALKSGELAADAVHAALGDGDVSASRFASYGEHLSRGMDNMRTLVCAFYDQAFSFRQVIERGGESARSDINECLTGNVFRDYDGLFALVKEFLRDGMPLRRSA